MSYPKPRYLGDTGEITGQYQPASQQPDLTYKSGGTAHTVRLYEGRHRIDGTPGERHDTYWL
jgi:hypothetical protein